MKIEWPIIGHERIKNFLEKCLHHQSLHHTYIFSGSRGLGKKKTAEYFIQSLLCHGKEVMLPCKTCTSCHYFQNNIHPDHHTIAVEYDDSEKLKKNISIEQIKKVQQTLSRFPLLQGYKTVLIDNADLLSEKASNALLKTLEEPGKKTVIILIADDLKNILPTLQSRSQILRFYRVKNDDIYNALVQSGTERDTALLLTRLSFGHPGRAYEYLLEKNKLEDYMQKVSHIISLFFKPIHERLVETKFYLSKNSENSETLSELLDICLCVLRDVMVMKNNNEDLVQNIFAKKEIGELSKIMSSKKIIHLFNNIFVLKKYIVNNVSKIFLYENFLINI